MYYNIIISNIAAFFLFSCWGFSILGIRVHNKSCHDCSVWPHILYLPVLCVSLAVCLHYWVVFAKREGVGHVLVQPVWDSWWVCPILYLEQQWCPTRLVVHNAYVESRSLQGPLPALQAGHSGSCPTVWLSHIAERIHTRKNPVSAVNH